MASPVNNPFSPHLAGVTFGTLQALAEARRANGGANGLTQPAQSATCPITPRTKVSEWITQQPSPFQNHSGGHQPIQGRHNLTQGHHNLAPESRTDNVSAAAVINNTNNTNTRLRGITHQRPRVKPSVPLSHASATLSSPLSISTFSSEPQSVVDGLKRKTFADGEDKESVYEPKSGRSSISSRPGRAEKVIIDLTISDDEDDEPAKPAPTRDDDDDLIFLGSRPAQTPALILGPNAAADYARPILPLPQRRRDCNGAQSPQAEGLSQQQNGLNQTIHSQKNGFQQQNGSHQNHHRQTNGVHQNTAAAASALPQQESPNYPSTRSQAATAAAAAVAAHQEEDARPETKTRGQVAATAAVVAATATEAAPQQESRYKFRTRRQYAAAATAAAAPYPPHRVTHQTATKERSRSISPAYMLDVFEEPAALKGDEDDKVEVVMDEIVVASPGGDGSSSTNKEVVRIEGDEDDDDDVRPHARKTPATVTPAAVEHSPNVSNSATSPSSDQDSHSVIDSIDSSTELDSDIDIEFDDDDNDDDDDYDGDDDDDEYLPRPTARKTPAVTTHTTITIDSDSDSELSDIESTISANDDENEEEEEASAPFPSIEPPPAGFFSLPRELRDKVYRHLLTTPQPIPVHFLWTRVVGRRITRRTRSRARANNNHTTATAGGSFSFFDSDNEDSDLDTRIDTRVLRVCRQIAEEGLRVLYGENTFLYTLRDVAEVKKHIIRLANAQLQQQQQQQQRQRRPSPRTRNCSVQSPVSPSFPSAVSAAARDCDINLEKYGHLIRHMAIELDRNRTGDEYQELMCAALEAIVPEGYDKWEWGFSPSVFSPVQPKIRLSTLTITISPCVPRGLKQLLAEQNDEFGTHGTSTANSNNNNHKDVSKNAGGNDNDNRPIHPRLLAGLTVAKFFSPDSGVLRALQAVQTDFLRVNVHVNSDAAKDSVAGADIEREVDSDNEEADDEEDDDLDDFDEEDDDDDESFHDGSDDEADNHIQEEDEEEEEEDDDDEQEEPEDEDEESDPILYPPNLHPQHLETTLDLRYTPSRLAQLASQGTFHQHDPLIQTRRAALGAHFASTLANLRRHIEDACLRPWWSVRRGRITGIGAFGMGGSSVGGVKCGGVIDDGRFGKVTPTLGVGGSGSGGGGGGYGVWEEHAAAEVRRRNQRVDMEWVFDRDAYDDLRLEEFMREMEEAREEGEELPGTEEERWMDRGGKSLVVTFFRDKKDKVLKAIRI
ncbi:hypothetical protein VTJ04DRAFT_8042 [Mycothermus thermophilus]|uniref:uncharacterized protein n=1 Tax=Humicola insolens TaxID=85995 RepID=UPI00374353E1